MSQFDEYIAGILDGVRLSKARRAELEEELRDHLEALKNDLMDEGLSPEEAGTAAIAEFGSSDMINKIYKKRFTFYMSMKDSLNRHRLLKGTLSWAYTIIMVFIISMMLRSYAFASTQVRQCSMQDTLYEGQRLILWKVDYYFSGPRRGDIVIINTEKEKGDFLFYENTREFFEDLFNGEPEDLNRLVKRVIGLPGDTIDIRDGKVFINDSIYEESYVKGVTYPRSISFPVTVPEGFCFVMGDNRENSLDSRDLGFIPLERIEGKAIFRIWPLDKFGVID